LFLPHTKQLHTHRICNVHIHAKSLVIFGVRLGAFDSAVVSVQQYIARLRSQVP